MTHSRSSTPSSVRSQAMRKRMAGTTQHDSAGFTLIELVVVVAILPLVVGGIAVALISVFSLQNSVSNRVSDSNDALVASTVFNRDVQSAQMFTTDPNPRRPGWSRHVAHRRRHQVLGLEWGASVETALPRRGLPNRGLVRQRRSSGSSEPTTVYALRAPSLRERRRDSGYTTQQLSSDIGT